jgi:hypothetical protein
VVTLISSCSAIGDRDVRIGSNPAQIGPAELVRS